MTPTLKRGDVGADVKRLQSILLSQGYFTGAVLGNFKDLTEAAVLAFQGGHNGKDGKPLKTDGVVGPKTWWALTNPDIARQVKPGTKPDKVHELIPDGITGDREAVLKVALDQLAANTREIPDGSNTGDGVTKFHQWYGMGPEPWCLMSAQWCLHQGMGELTIPKLAKVSTLWDRCLRTGQAYKLGSGYVITPGDLFIMVHNNAKRTGHCGIVLAVSPNRQTLAVLEGNSGNRFALRRRQVGANNHVGTINPYGDAKTLPKFKFGLPAVAEDGTLQTR